MKRRSASVDPNERQRCSQRIIVCHLTPNSARAKTRQLQVRELAHPEVVGPRAKLYFRTNLVVLSNQSDESENLTGCQTNETYNSKGLRQPMPRSITFKTPKSFMESKTYTACISQQLIAITTKKKFRP